MKAQTFELMLLKKRILFLIETMGDKINVLETMPTDPELCKVQITIKDSMDIMNLFHAGIECGANNSIKK